MKLIECVPNFSEGRDPDVIDQITSHIASVAGVALLDVDPGEAANRTVVTFVGSPEAVSEAAFRAIRTAAALIDMTRHAGEHPRMGATDVCPFVPLEGVTMEECAELARQLGRRVGDELGIPVYLYEAASTRPARRLLADVRRGEYEGLAGREDPPDFGPAFNPRSGATAIGAREFLIAYNVNLNTRDRRLADQIAGTLRESGSPRRDADGRIVRDAEGRPLRDPGRFNELRAVGWYIAEYGRAQISFNLTNFKVTALHEVFDAAREGAGRLGLRVTGSEVVGLVPREALLAAGDHYLAKQGKTTGVPEAERVHAAVVSLGLNDVTTFDPAAKVIEYRYRGGPSGLVAMPVAEFVDHLSLDAPAPGGGSVAALCGALSAGLAAMVAALTFGKRGMEETRPHMEELGRAAQILKDWFLEAVTGDTEAFTQVLAAARLPGTTPEEISARVEAIESANLGAARVPLEVLEKSAEALDIALAVVKEGNPNAVSDAAVAATCALAAAEGAALNVRINTGALTNREVAGELADAAHELLARCRAAAREAQQTVDRALDG